MQQEGRKVTVDGPFHQFEIPFDRQIVLTDKLRFPWKEDRNGYFLVKIEDDHIYCGFVRDRVMDLEFRGKNPYNIIKEIARRDIINKEHMGYIAAELVRARHCLDSRVPFVQR